VPCASGQCERQRCARRFRPEASNAVEQFEQAELGWAHMHLAAGAAFADRDRDRLPKARHLRVPAARGACGRQPWSLWLPVIEALGLEAMN
jgi:hypothetical protein